MFNKEEFQGGFYPIKLPDVAAARTELEAMTHEQLDALPVYAPFGYDVYDVPESGEVVIANGRTIRGLTPGNKLTIPKQQDVAYAFFVGETTPLTWLDQHGESWRPVLTQDGWKKAPFRL